MNIANMRIGARLSLGFGLVLVLLTGIAVLGTSSMSGTNDALHHVVDVNVQKMGLLQDMSQSIHIVSRVMRNVVLIEDEPSMQKEMEIISSARKAYDAADALMEKQPLGTRGKELMRIIKEAQTNARQLNNEVIKLGLANKNAEATKLLITQAGPATEKWQEALQEFISLQKKNSKTDEEAASETFAHARQLMLGLSALAIIVGSLIAWYLTRSITRPMHEAVRIAQEVASGNLDNHINVTSTDETGQLLQALKDMSDSLQKIVGEVRKGTDTIATASSQIAAGNQDLSSRTEEQASSLEETASSLEELTSTVRQNADNARQANTLASAASEVAVKGGQMVGKVVATMASINDSSKKIVDIISVIDGIAFQTNILALNAAVEAARAGEQGRGFAVVASEVRALAQRSGAAAKEIKGLIDDSVEKVNAGSELVDQTGRTMDDIVSSVHNVTNIIGEISSASAEQTTGIEQINMAVTQMDQVTQQNAALVEEAAAAAESMQDQARSLAQVVSVFRMPG